jgi:hypothetical protein
MYTQTRASAPFAGQATNTGMIRASGAADEGLTMEQAAARPDYEPSNDVTSDWQRERRAKMRYAGIAFGSAMVLGMMISGVKHLTDDSRGGSVG